MTELLTILGIGLTLECLLCWAFSAANAGQSVILEESPRSPIVNIQEILPRYSGQRDFRVIAELKASPVEMERHMPFSYGDSLPDDPSRIATNVSYHREHQTKTHAIWHVSYKFDCPYITSDGVGLTASEFARAFWKDSTLATAENRRTHA